MRVGGRSGSVNPSMLTGVRPPMTHRIAVCMSHVHVTLWTCGAHTASDPSSHGQPAPVKDHSIEPKQAAVCKDVRYDCAHAGQRKARWKSLE